MFRVGWTQQHQRQRSYLPPSSAGQALGTLMVMSGNLVQTEDPWNFGVPARLTPSLAGLSLRPPEVNDVPLQQPRKMGGEATCSC
mmetsp:Transcript_7985/g.14894  ORF Transcript_7985/g.14894 Transcript_7985/m.14894 type:complete len:85 (+) Transcript_7985:756-1010(+)